MCLGTVRRKTPLGIAILPAEADSKLVVDANTVLPLPVPAKLLEPVTGRDPELLELTDPVQLVELAASSRPQLRRAGTAISTGLDAIDSPTRARSQTQGGSLVLNTSQ